MCLAHYKFIHVFTKVRLTGYASLGYAFRANFKNRWNNIPAQYISSGLDSLGKSAKINLSCSSVGIMNRSSLIRGEILLSRVGTHN